ncbi:late competence development ComFB family protein [Desulfofalx alkaliphila]|uniref:late competence development ComFB family protein n=1 Tax=Desulfofalx alkaliphila TaxID=105483 RepID=UPI0004E20535|nr:late competence development ComFB family protein [Desulfofalx alkaliphila]
MLYNYTETAVLHLIDSVYNEFKKRIPGVCTCERCRQDVMAIALNNLPPHYIVTETGKIITQVNFDLLGGKVLIITQLMKAMDKVHLNPRH